MRRRTAPTAIAIGTAVGAALVLLVRPAVAATPSIDLTIAPGSSTTQVSTALQILIALTVLTVAPAILLLMTSFTRIVIVLSFARTALATNNLPPNQIIVGLAIILTVFVMGSTFQAIYQDAWVPYQAGKLTQTQALTQAEAPLRSFMLRQTDAADITLFENLETEVQKSQSAAPSSTSDTRGAATPSPVATAATSVSTAASSSPPLSVLVPAFVIHELRVSFEMGFILFIPFVIIDLVVASSLMAMGMIMLPPELVSLPFKLLLFVLANGWGLVVQSLMLSFH